MSLLCWCCKQTLSPPRLARMVNGVMLLWQQSHQLLGQASSTSCDLLIPACGMPTSLRSVWSLSKRC